MNEKCKTGRAFTVLGMLLTIGTICIVVLGIHVSPVMLKRPAGAVERAEEMLSAVCSGDYEAAAGMMYGTPTLGTTPKDDSPVAALIWDAFLESMDFELLGDCYASDSGLAVDVKIRSLDVSGVIEGLDRHAQVLLNRRIAEAQDITEIYDAQNEFRQEIITEILQEATLQALEKNRQYQEHTLSLRLTYAQGQWWIMPDAALLNVLAGSVTG